MAEQFWMELLAIGRTWAEHSGGRIRIAIHEADATTDHDEEAQEHLKIDEKRCGRDFRLYGFMGEIAGVPSVMGDFAEVAFTVKNKVPEAFAESVAQLNALEKYLPSDDIKKSWRAMWEVA